MTKAIGVQMEFTGTDNSVGVFMRDVAGSQLGDKDDIFIFESGTEDMLGPQGMYSSIDREASRADAVGPVARRVEALGGRAWARTASSTACRSSAMPTASATSPTRSAPIPTASTRSPGRCSSRATRPRGKVAYDQTWTYSLDARAAHFLQATRARRRSQDVADMTGEEAQTRSSTMLIERKKAGQFRTLHSAFEEQVQLLTNKEIDMINCWEPATKRGQPEARPGHGALRLHRRRLLQVGPRRLHRTSRRKSAATSTTSTRC